MKPIIDAWKYDRKFLLGMTLMFLGATGSMMALIFRPNGTTVIIAIVCNTIFWTRIAKYL